MQTVIINNPAPRAAVYTEPKRESIPPTPPAAPPRHMAPPHEPPKKRGHLARNILLALTAIFLICSLILIFGKRTDVTASTSQRVKLDVVTFQNDCIVDELDWFENIANTEKQLQNFYNETGVQPYIVLKAYDPELTSDEKKEAYANTWYDEHIDNQGTFLFMYFAEEDADNEIGLMTTVNGKQVTSVMDAEAVEIFWNYIDEYWYSDASTDDLFANVFDKTAARIMRVTTTAMDVLKTIVIGLTVLCALLLITVILKEKFRRDKEKAEETERILSTPLNDMEKPSDDLLNKYSN